MKLTLTIPARLSSLVDFCAQFFTKSQSKSSQGISLENFLQKREEAYRKYLVEYHKQKLQPSVRRFRMRKRKQKAHERFLRLMPSLFVTLGSVILANAFWPILSYFIFVSPEIQAKNLVSPLPDIAVLRQTHSLQTAQAATPDMVRPRVIQNDLDYTNLTNWFPDAQLPVAETTQSSGVTEYILNIPSLEVEDALVKVGGTNLDTNLIQYPGTSDPGALGSPVIFGHSVLRQFYSPSKKNKRRYFSIFSKIMTMKPGDKIYLDYDGIRYTYSVTGKKEVKPEDPAILEQDISKRQLKLITCVPEGTYLRRGILMAELETVEDKKQP